MEALKLSKLLNPTCLQLRYCQHFHVSSRSTLRFTITARLQRKQETNNTEQATPTKIVLSSSAPPPLSEERTKIPDKSNGSFDNALLKLKRLTKKLLAVLSNLPLAIGEMTVIAGLMVLGTVIDQGEATDFYMQKYSDESPYLGFMNWRWVLTLGFDHMFSSPVFLGMLALLGVSLMACSYTTQLPLIKTGRRWKFLQTVESVRRQEVSDTLRYAAIQDLGVNLMGSGYEVFLKGPFLYAFKGLAGRIAPVGVHLAMILIMAGGTCSATGSFKGSVTVPQGLNFVVGDILSPSGFLSMPTEAFNTEIHVNKFSMDYYESGEVSQFHSDLSLFNLDGKEVMRKTISVNDPLRYNGITIYQTDWSISALQVLKDGEGPFNLAMAPLQINGDKKLYGTFLPVGDPSSPDVKGISMLARDLQSVVLYDAEGKFVGVRRPNSNLPIEIDGVKIIIEDAIGSTGLELKTDPAVPVVYAGFGALMLTTCISFLSHSQVWAVQDGTTVVVGGKSNRAKGEFETEFNRVLDQVPEVVEPDVTSG